MKKHLFKLTFLAMAGLAFASSRAQAQESYLADDLLLTVYQTGNNTEYTIDLGQATLYMTGGAKATASSGNAINLGNYGADLTAIFGAWGTSSTTFWSIVGAAGTTGNTSGPNAGMTTSGGPDYIDTLFLSNKEATPGTQSSAWARSSAGAQSTTSTKIASYGSTLPSSSSSFNSNPLTGPGAVVLATNASNSYQGNYKGDIGGTITTGGAFFLEDTFGQGTGLGGATLDLYRVTANSNVDIFGTPVTPPAGQTYLGSFNFTSGGVLQFSTSASSFAAIPEPSTYAFIGFGSLLLMFWYRRRINRAMSA